MERLRGNKQRTRLQRRQRAPPIVGNHDVIKEAEALTKVTLVMDRGGFEKLIWKEGEGRRPRWREPHGQRLVWDSVGHMGKTHVHLGWGLRGVQRSRETEFGDD